ncbi:SPOR domain-containing protein [Legionella drancourtii]|uniref:SPOR domain-containing protein n=1 Tax=Legionella drancourtii LLAP12 TaxID=658187 RepID=G9EIV1_9GAMM|nr:SPOR domain-containing protein [Legionella drancourtii]EHL32869.1 hypothetical protein LDG_5107 [Legionella drancourtii LLAP12]
MGREYSNRRPSRARSRAPNQFLVITITFLLGYFTATVFDIETITHWVNSQVLAHQEANKAPSKPPAQRQVAVPPKPKFEFYTLLTNEKVPNSEKASTAQASSTHTATNTTAVNAAMQTAINTAATSAVKVTTPRVPQPSAVKTVDAKPIAPTAGRGAYSVQVASFKARQDAEHMKGLLTLKGFNVSVVPINHAHRGVWFRVVVGPYANRTLAQKAQIDLARNERLRGMLTAG